MPGSHPDETLLVDILIDWEDRVGRGEDISLEDLCGERTDLLGELRRRAERLVAFGNDDSTDVSLPAEVARQARSRPGSASSHSRFTGLVPHAEGGLGEIFLAQNHEFSRVVALKFLRSHYARDDESRRRFLVETRMTGRLEHPGIVPIYGLGEDENGQPCYAMEVHPRSADGPGHP